MAYAYDQENLSVAGTVVQLTRALITPTATRPASEILLTIETAPIRYTLDGTDPVGGGAGQYAATGANIKIVGTGNIQQLKMIRDGGSSAVVDVTYFR